MHGDFLRALFDPGVLGSRFLDGTGKAERDNHRPFETLGLLAGQQRHFVGDSADLRRRPAEVAHELGHPCAKGDARDLGAQGIQAQMRQSFGALTDGLKARGQTGGIQDMVHVLREAEGA